MSSAQASSAFATSLIFGSLNFISSPLPLVIFGLDSVAIVALTTDKPRVAGIGVLLRPPSTTPVVVVGASK